MTPENTPTKPQFRFTRDAGSALLYYGDEFVAKFSKPHREAMAAVLIANDIMRQEIDAFTTHVGASTFQEAVDVLIQTNAGHMDALQKSFDQIKALREMRVR